VSDHVEPEAELEEAPDAGVGPVAPRRTGGANPVLAAAMLAVGEIIEPEKTKAEVVQTDDRPEDDGDELDLDFGHLPPV